MGGRPTAARALGRPSAEADRPLARRLGAPGIVLGKLQARRVPCGVLGNLRLPGPGRPRDEPVPVEHRDATWIRTPRRAAVPAIGLPITSDGSGSAQPATIASWNDSASDGVPPRCPVRTTAQPPRGSAIPRASRSRTSASARREAPRGALLRPRAGRADERSQGHADRRIPATLNRCARASASSSRSPAVTKRNG